MEFPKVSMSKRKGKSCPTIPIPFKSPNHINHHPSIFPSSLPKTSKKTLLNFQKHIKVPLPPLNLVSYSRDSSLINLKLEEKEPKSHPLRKNNKSLEKLEKISFSNSVKDLKIDCWKAAKYLKEQEESSIIRTTSVETCHLETPTFRNLSCDFNEDFKSSLRNIEVDSGINQGKNSLLQITSHFASLPKDLSRNSRNFHLGEVKTVTKIKVLHQKFPSDMFSNNSLKV
jgi:hypothetical protein